ncbi:MAG: DNA repair protein RadC [Butyrivibrio sp.]|nr:DNA repair protein RadC [Butyrivibrio sp.]
MIREGDADISVLPYERFEKFGAQSLTDAELLAIVLRTGTTDKTPTDIGREILNAHPDKKLGLSVLYHLSLKELMEIGGIGKVKAVKLKCIAEICRRITISETNIKPCFDSADKISDYYMEKLRHEENERVIMLSLNNRKELIAESLISVGTVNSSLLSPRNIFIEAVKNRAVSIVLVHNHPGGDPTPSRADIRVTGNILDIGRMIDIELLDHIIIGDNKYISFREMKLI